MHWLWEWQREARLFYVNTFARAWLCATLFPPVPVRTLFVSRNSTVQAYWYGPLLEERGRKMLGTISEDASAVPAWAERARKTAASLLSCSKELFQRNWGDASNGELAEEYLGFDREYLGLTKFVTDIRAFNRVGLETLQSYARTRLKGVREAADAVGTLASAVDFSAAGEEERDLLRILVRLLEHPQAAGLFRNEPEEILKGLGRFPEIAALLEEHVRAYEWLPAGYSEEPPWSKRYFVTLLSKLDPAGAEQGPHQGP